MSKPTVLAVTAITMALGLTVAISTDANAGCRKHKHKHKHKHTHTHTHRHYGAVHIPFDDFRPRHAHRPAHWHPYRPAYIYYPAPYPVRDAYGPVCVRSGWTINRYGEPRCRCISW